MNDRRESDKLGFWSIVLLAINSIIGSGIFLTPGSVVSRVGSKALLVYLIAASFAAILAITFAAAAKYVTKSGAAYAYSKAAFGENVGFYMGVLRYFSASVAWGVMAVAVIKSTISIFGGDPNSFQNVSIGFVVLMLLIWVINLFGQSTVKYIMNLSTIGKLLALGLVILAGAFLLLSTGENHFGEIDTLQVAGKNVVPAINSIIGSGIFLTPGSVVSRVGSKALLVYLIAASFAAILAITFAAAAKYVTKSGAAYAYSKAAFGENVGFYMGVLRYFSASVAWGVMAVAVIKSTISIFGGDPNSFQNVSIGFVVLMLLIWVINLFGQSTVKYIMNLSTIGKLLALGLVILAGAFLLLSTGENHFGEIDTLQVAGKNVVPAVTTSSFVMAIVSAFYAFTGFEAIASGSEDMKEPSKNLPRAIPLAILIIALVYIGVVAVAMVLNPRELLETKQVVAVAAIFSSPILRAIILVGALVSMFGINIASSFHAPRILEAMARENQFPKWLAKRTKRNFPARTFLITLILAVLVPMAFHYSTDNLIILSATVRFLGFIVVPLGVIKFYLGRNGEPVLTTNRNKITDLIFPIFSILITLFLLYKYDWAAEFSVTINGVTSLNWFAIGALIFGAVILPAILFVLTKNERKKAETMLEK